MHIIYNQNRHTLFLVAALFVTARGSVAINAQEASRIWVDTSGLHSVSAMLVEVEESNVRLILNNGNEIKMRLDQLSKRDFEYVKSFQEQRLEGNALRMQPPPVPNTQALPRIKLPAASFKAPENTRLELGPVLYQAVLKQAANPRDRGESRRTPVSVTELPRSLPADRSPVSYRSSPSVISIEDLDFNDQVSRPIAIETQDGGGTGSTSIAFSVSSPIRLESVPTRQQIIRCHLLDQQSVVVMQHDRSIRLLDHDPASGRSLVLLDSGTLEEGGVLALAHGWNSSNLRVSHRRRLPESNAEAQWLSADASTQMSGSMKVSWARLIDAEHVLVMIDRSIVLWNLVSGEPVYQIDHVDKRGAPAISGGKRYIAIPKVGVVDLHDTQTGNRLGRIRVERQVPGISFSPYGNALAIVTSRRLRVWNLPAAALDSDIKVHESLGREAAVWVDHDFLISGTGVLVSLFRGLPIWKYDVTGCQMESIGDHVAILRKSPLSQLTTLRLPHREARRTLKRMDASIMKSDTADWRVPGRSLWDGNQWVDRDVRLGTLPARMR